VQLIEEYVHHIFLATTNLEPPSGKSTPRRIMAISTPSISSNILLSQGDVLDSAAASGVVNGICFFVMRDINNAGSKHDTNDVLRRILNPAGCLKAGNICKVSCIEFVSTLSQGKCICEKNLHILKI
jgi:hypothetical protein